MTAPRGGLSYDANSIKAVPIVTTDDTLPSHWKSFVLLNKYLFASSGASALFFNTSIASFTYSGSVFWGSPRAIISSCYIYISTPISLLDMRVFSNDTFAELGVRTPILLSDISQSLKLIAIKNLLVNVLCIWFKYHIIQEVK